MLALWDRIAYWGSGEWLLSNRSNGGSIILLRSFLSSALIFALTLIAANWLDPERAYTFSLKELQIQLVEKIPWYGVIFATIYAALYARFASQWSYLANLYNSIKQTTASPDANDDVIAEWKAGFIEDAEYLHLACKENFASIIYQWAKEQKVKEKYVSYTPGNEARFTKLITEIEAVYNATCAKYNNP